MQRIVTDGGLFIDGNPATSTQGTVVTADWLNSLQEEMAAIVEGSGGVLSPADNGQVLAALLTLGLQNATVTLKGTVELATNAEVQAGTDTGRVVTPAGLASFDQTLAKPGTKTFPGGLILKWGVVTCVAGAGSVVFPMAFPSEILAYGYFNNSTSTSGVTTAATGGGISGMNVSSSYATMSGTWIALGR